MTDAHDTMTVARAKRAATARWEGHQAVDWTRDFVAILVRRADVAEMRRITSEGPAWARFAELVSLVPRQPEQRP